MNDLHGIWLVVAAAAGAIVATTARLIPDEIDVSYPLTVAAFLAICGGGLYVTLLPAVLLYADHRSARRSR